MSAHDVRHDTAGWSNRPRLTCYSPTCDGATLVAQPYMTSAVWDAKVWVFMVDHPATVLPCADRGGPSARWNGEHIIIDRSPASGDSRPPKAAPKGDPE